MPTFLAFGGILFWVICGLIFIVICTTVEEFEQDGYNKANFGWPLFLNMVTFTLLYLFYRDNISLSLSTKQIVLYSIGYLFAGILWSFFKWMRLVRYQYKKYLLEVEKNKTDYEKEFKIYQLRAANNPSATPPIPYKTSPENYKPRVSREKDQLISWILFWPYSVIRYVFVSLLGDLMDELIKKLTGIYETITNSQFKIVENENIKSESAESTKNK